MNFKTLQSKYNKQIEVYSELKTLLQESIPVIEKFDGKQVNVRLERAVKEVLENENRRLYIHVKNRTRTLCISTFNSSYLTYNSDGLQTSFFDSIDDTSVEVHLSAEKKIDAALVKRNIDHIIKTYNKKIEEITYCLNTYDIMKNDYQAVLDQIQKFKDAYSYNFRIDAGCDFKWI